MDKLNALTYGNLDIELTGSQNGKRFSVRVTGETPDGRRMESRQAEKIRVTDEDFENAENLADRSLVKEDLLAFGERLGDLLLPGFVRELFNGSLNAVKKDGKGLRLRLFIEPAKLAGLPWEVALVPMGGRDASEADFLALNDRISIARFETTGQPLAPVAAPDKYRVVIALANPRIKDPRFQPLDVTRDKNAIQNAIRLINSKAEVIEQVVVQPATRASLGENLQGAHVLHFAGHGTFETAGTTSTGGILKKGKIILEDGKRREDPFDSELLAALLDSKTTRLVVLGACNTATRNESSAWGGVAPALIRKNVPAVVAMQFTVFDSSVAIFIADLYSMVFAGYSIDEAVAVGRRALFANTNREDGNGDWAEDRDWGTPVLYLLPDDGVLFPPDTEVRADEHGNPIVTVHQQLGKVLGSVVGIDADTVNSGTVIIKQNANEVGPGANLLGGKFGKIG